MRCPPRESLPLLARSGSGRKRLVRFSLQFAKFACATAMGASWSAARSISPGRCSPRTADKERFSMIYSTDRILTAHAGSLPRPDDLREMVLAKARGEPVDQAALDARLKSAVAETVKRQVACGLDVINDGELSKPNFTDYVSARIAGCENRPSTGSRRLSMTARDETKFAEYFAAHPRPRYSGGQTMPVCVDKLRYVGQAELARDLDNFRAALAGVTVREAFLPANTPGTIEHWMGNEYYANDEAFLFAIAEAMREEYSAIVDADRKSVG